MPVAVGTGGTPTLTGFRIDGAVRLEDPTGPYGAYQLSVAAFSALRRSAAVSARSPSTAQTAPGLVGSSVSHGCVRMTNDDITKLANMVPVGTPVATLP